MISVLYEASSSVRVRDLPQTLHMETRSALFSCASRLSNTLCLPVKIQRYCKVSCEILVQSSTNSINVSKLRFTKTGENAKIIVNSTQFRKIYGVLSYRFCTANLAHIYFGFYDFILDNKRTGYNNMWRCEPRGVEMYGLCLDCECQLPRPM